MMLSRASPARRTKVSSITKFVSERYRYPLRSLAQRSIVEMDVDLKHVVLVPIDDLQLQLHQPGMRGRPVPKLGPFEIDHKSAA